jgi:low affinity Fe/Cu permease
MSNSTNTKNENIYKLFAFSFTLAIVTYGFALTNYTLSIDNEMPVLADFGLTLGRWGQNLIRYHLFGGHLQYFTLLISLFLFSVAAVRLTKVFKFEGLAAYFFCGLFLTFPQISYQVVFGVMADVAGFGVLLSVLSVELFIKGYEIKSLTKKIALLSLVAFVLTFTLSIYQAFVLVPPTIYLIYFFQNTFTDSFSLKEEIKKMLLFGGIIIISVLLYVMSVKAFCPPIPDSGYLTSFLSGEGNNQFLDFCSIWFKNLVGSFYYGDKTFVLVLLSSLSLFVLFFIQKKHVAIRFITLLIILILPFIMSYFITNGYHPPRLYLTSNLVFAFVIVFTLDKFKIGSFTITKTAIALILFINIYFITNLFYTVNTIYKHDKKVAERMDNIIQSKYPDFAIGEKYVYFYGYFPYEYHQKFRLDKSEIFGGSFFNWDLGDNYRLVNFFRDAGVEEYKMINTKEQLDLVKDSIAKMPIWPNHDSVKMFNNIVVIKLGNEKGARLYFE